MGVSLYTPVKKEWAKTLCRYFEKQHNIHVGLPDYCHIHLCKIGCIETVQ